MIQPKFNYNAINELASQMSNLDAQDLDQLQLIRQKILDIQQKNIN